MYERRSGSNYPVLIGVISLIGLIILWNLPEGELLPLPLSGDAAVEARVPDAGSTEAATPVLVWGLEGAVLPSQSALASCLRAGGWDRVRVLGGEGRPLSITHGPVVLGVATKGSGLEVRTPLNGQRHLTVSLHGAVAACAGQNAAALVDELTGRHPDKSTWPTAAREAGLPLPLLVQIRAGQGFLHSQGLERLGLFEVLLVGADTPRQRRVLERAAVAVLLADDPAATKLVLGEREVALSGAEVSWWPAGAAPQWRALGGAERAFAPPAEPPPMAPRSAPVRTAPSAAPPTAPRRAMPPTTPLFRPDYRE